MNSRKALWLIAALAVLPYLNILNNELFLDDLDYIVNNAYIRDWRYVPRMFTENLIAGAGKSSDYYRPAILLANTLGYALWGVNPMGYHLFSILFHLLNSLGVYLLLRGMVSRTSGYVPCPSGIKEHVPLATAILFAVHPVQTEAVASASALGILMGMFFLTLALGGHILRTSRADGKGGWLLAGSLLAAAAAVLSKETMVVAPGMIFLVEFFFPREERGAADRFKRALIAALPYLALSGFYILLRFTVLNFGGTGNLYRGENIFTGSWLVRLYTFFTVLVEMGKVVVGPKKLYMERGTVLPVYASFWHGKVLFGFVLAAFLLAAAAAGALLKPGGPRSEIKGRIIGFGVLWSFFALVPVSNVLIPISTLMVESWLYTPIVGPALVFALILEKLPGKAGVGVLVLAVSACAVRTAVQNRVWKTPVSFYEHNLRYAPQSARFQTNLAMAYAEQMRYNEAIAGYRRAIELNDQYPQTHHNLANTYLALGRAAEAEAEYQSAIRMDPGFHFSYVSLASLYLRARRPDLAENILEDLVRKVPDRWEGYYNLGVVRHLEGDKARALELWRKGLEIDPLNKTILQAVQNFSGPHRKNKGGP